MTEISRNAAVRVATSLLMLAGLAAAMAAPLILFIEAHEWLFSREWPGLTLADGLALFGIEHEIPETDSQRAVDVAMAAPLSVALFLTGVSMFLTGASLGSWEAERRLERELADDIFFSSALRCCADDVGLPSIVRLLLLERLLSLLFLLGVGTLAIAAVLPLAGTGSSWAAPAGVALILMAWLGRAAMRRKLQGRAD